MHKGSNRPAATATYCAMVLPVVCLPRPQKITLQGIRRHKTSAREAGQERARESACPFPKYRIWVRALERRGMAKGHTGRTQQQWETHFWFSRKPTREGTQSSRRPSTRPSTPARVPPPLQARQFCVEACDGGATCAGYDVWRPQISDRAEAETSFAIASILCWGSKLA